MSIAIDLETWLSYGFREYQFYLTRENEFYILIRQHREISRFYKNYWYIVHKTGERTENITFQIQKTGILSGTTTVLSERIFNLDMTLDESVLRKNITSKEEAEKIAAVLVLYGAKMITPDRTYTKPQYRRMGLF